MDRHKFGRCIGSCVEGGMMHKYDQGAYSVTMFCPAGRAKNVSVEKSVIAADALGLCWCAGGEDRSYVIQRTIKNSQKAKPAKYRAEQQ